MPHKFLFAYSRENLKLFNQLNFILIIPRSFVCTIIMKILIFVIFGTKKIKISDALPL